MQVFEAEEDLLTDNGDMRFGEDSRFELGGVLSESLL